LIRIIDYQALIYAKPWSCLLIPMKLRYQVRNVNYGEKHSEKVFFLFAEYSPFGTCRKQKVYCL
jgi:hypothetical protein